MENGKEKLVSFCGLYCGNCNKFKKGKCVGCADNTKATWCKIRTCCLENSFKSCAECSDPGIQLCKKFNNPIGILFGVIFNSDRAAGLQLVKDEGYNGFVHFMIESGKMTLPRRRK